MQTKSEIISLRLRDLWRWRWEAAISLGALALIVWGAMALGARELMEQVVAQLRGAGAPVFFVAMALLPAVGFPLLPFALAAGPVFAPTLGTGGVVACSILAVAVNAALSYALAATLLRASVERLMRRLGYRLPDSRRAPVWFFVALVRVAPGLPFWAQSYLLGLMRVRFGAYMVVSTLVPAGYLTGAIVFGDAMRHGRTGTGFFALGLIMLAGTALYFLRKKLTARAGLAAPALAVPTGVGGAAGR